MRWDIRFRLSFRTIRIALLPLACVGQGLPVDVSVVATKTTFIWGEVVKVTAAVRDAQGVDTHDPVTWSVIPAAAASVASDGTVTPRQFVDFTVQAQSGNLQGQVLMQAVPKKIVVTPQSATMIVGATQQVVATALDVNDRPIPGAALKWSLSVDVNNPMAEIDSTGRLHALVAGQLDLGAYVDYGYNPWLLQQFYGDTYVQIQPPQTYKLERIFRSESTSDSSVLRPLPSALLATDNGFDFVASLDGLGSALLEWTPDAVTPIVVSGGAHASTGLPLIQITTIARNHNGDLLCGQTDGAAFQISEGPIGNVVPLLVPNSPLNGADQTGFIGSARNSVADSGMKVFSVQYSDAVTHAQAIGLFRGLGRGLSDSVVNTIDGLPGFPGSPFSVYYYGVADDGTVWFQADIGSPVATRGLFRSGYGAAAEKILQEGDALQGLTITNASPFTINPYENRFFVAANGDLVAGADTTKGGAFLRWTAANGFATPDVLQSPARGVYWYEPGMGALIDTSYAGGGTGLYLWNQSTVSPLLMLGDTSLDGSPVREIFSATVSRTGAIYAMIRTDANPMAIVRLAPDKQIVLKSGDTVPVGSLPLIGAMIPGADAGAPLVLAGGTTGSVARIGDDGNSLQPVVRVGDPLPGGGAFAGTTLTYDHWQARSLSDGRIVFADLNGVYVWNAGAVDRFLQYPIPSADAPLYCTPAAFTINSQGDLAGYCGGNTIYDIHNGAATRVFGGSDRLSGASATHESVPIIDDSGRIAFPISTGDNLVYYIALWDGTATNIIFGPGVILPDGRAVKTTRQSLIGAGGVPVTGAYFADGTGTLVKYVNNAWQYVIANGERTATGNTVGFAGLEDMNSAGDLAFYYYGVNYTKEIAVKRGSTFHAIHSMGDLTPDGDLLIAVNQLRITDDGTVYLLGVNDEGRQVIYRASPLQ